MSCTYEEYDPEAVGATAVGLHVALGIGVLGLLIMVPLILYHKAPLEDRQRTVLLWGIVATSVLWVATFMTWTFANPGFVGPPIVLRSISRGPYFGSTLIPWASNAVVRPGKIVRACNEAEAIAAVDAEPESGSVRVVGSGHSFSAIYETRGTSLYLDWCDTPLLLPGNTDNTEEDELKTYNGVVRISAGCSIATLVNFAGENNLEVRGIGGVHEQSIGGSIGTSLHGVDAWGFARFIEGLEVYPGGTPGVTSTKNRIDSMEWWSSLGRRGIVLRADIRVFAPQTVHRETTGRASTAAVVEATRAAASSATADANTVGVTAHAILPPTGTAKWSLTVYTDRQPAAAGATVPDGWSAAMTYAFDNIVVPLITVAPWVAYAAPYDSSFFLAGSQSGRMPWTQAQAHAEASVAAVGEVAVPISRCTEAIEALRKASDRVNGGPVDLEVRPRRALPNAIKNPTAPATPPIDWAGYFDEDACCISYSILPPLTDGTTVRFHEEAAALLTPLDAKPHLGKMWTAADPEELPGAPPKFRWVAKPEYIGTVDPGSFAVLDARRLAWVGLLITTWIVAAAVAFSPLLDPIRAQLGSDGYLTVPGGGAFL